MLSSVNGQFTSFQEMYYLLKCLISTLFSRVSIVSRLSFGIRCMVPLMKARLHHWSLTTLEFRLVRALDQGQHLAGFARGNPLVSFFYHSGTQFHSSSIYPSPPPGVLSTAVNLVSPEWLLQRYGPFTLLPNGHTGRCESR